jgi:hypothetical protein
MARLPRCGSFAVSSMRSGMSALTREADFGV